MIELLDNDNARKGKNRSFTRNNQEQKHMSRQSYPKRVKERDKKKGKKSGYKWRLWLKNIDFLCYSIENTCIPWYNYILLSENQETVGGSNA